jgi:hypothetical protein
MFIITTPHAKQVKKWRKTTIDTAPTIDLFARNALAWIWLGDDGGVGPPRSLKTKRPW